MGKFYDSISDHHKSFIEQQKLFFVSSAPINTAGHINLSPKGLNCFKVLSENRVAYMDLIGSGNETAAHILENGRITFMFCSFDKTPLILRLYGNGLVVVPQDKQWESLSRHFEIFPSTRQIIVADIMKVQTSCGFGVPIYDFVAERKTHFDWAEVKGEHGLETYKKEKNKFSIDGLPTRF